MARSKKKPIPVYDRDGVLIDDQSYPGMELARKKIEGKFETRLHAMFCHHIESRPAPEVLAAIFVQGMAYGITEQSDTEER